MKVNGSKVKETVKENTSGQIQVIMKETGRKIKQKGKVSLSIRMGTFMKGNGKMTWPMEREPISTQEEQNI